MLAREKIAHSPSRLINGASDGMRRLLTGGVRLYQRYISILLPSSCRFYPSCSNYALEALQRKSLPVAIALIVWRVFRCQPFFKCGHDPVPGSHPERETKK